MTFSGNKIHTCVLNCRNLNTCIVASILKQSLISPQATRQFTGWRGQKTTYCEST